MKILYLEDDPHEAGLARRQASESRYRALVELSPDAIWLHHDGRFIFINPAGLKLLGATSPEQLLGHSIFEIIHPDDQAGVKERIKNALDLSSVPYFVEEKLIRLDGTVVPVELAATPFEEQGRMSFQVVCRDITARKQVEEALQQTNTTLQTLINAAPLAIVTIDRNGTVETWNSEAERIFGWSRAEAVGRPIPTIPAEEWPQVRLELAEEFKGVQRTGMELRRRRKDGSFVDVQLWTAPLRDATGIIVANMSILADISERKQAEAQIRYLADLFDRVSDAIISTGPPPDFTIASWNWAAELMYGWPAQEAMGRPISKMVQLQWTEAERAEITNAVLQTGQWRGELIHTRRDGKLVYIESNVQTVYDSDGQANSYVTVNRDVTRRKQAEQARQRQTERLQILNEISRGMLGVQSSLAIAQIALPRLRRLIPCQRASLTLLDFETHELVVVAVHAEYESETRLGLRQPLNPNFVAQLQKGPMVLMDDLRSLAESPVAKTLLAEGLRALLLAPLRVQEALIGSLNLGADQPNIFTEEHVAIAREVADLLAVAIQHAHLYEQVSAGRSRLEALSHQLLEAQETERRRLAYELHDEIGQMLTAVKLNLQVLQRQPQQPAQPVADSINLVEQAIQQVRHLSLNLHPSLLDDLGLVATLRWFLDGQRQRTNLKINLRVEPAEMQLPPHLNTVCFRVAQEALTNVIRHAQAQQVWVELAAQGSELSLIIHDDGIGFAVEESLKRASQGASLGLIGMQERVSLAAGRLEINSEPGRGCEIRAYFPLGQ